jgi:MFS superfamily sulfate permease-like transporter
MKRAHAIDATAAEALANFAIHFREKGGRFMLCGLKPELHAQVLRSHLGEVLGPENVLLTDKRHMGSLRRAIDKARHDLLAAGIDGQALTRAAGAELADGSAYSI